MIKLLFTFLLACFSSFLFGQYAPMVSESHTWKITNYGLFVMNYQETISGDTIIDGITYKNHWTQTEGYPAYLNGAVREDVETQRVYANYGGGEMLLYDFTLEVGDEAEVYGVGMLHPITVTEVSTVTVGGEQRKMITYTETEGLGGFWIEGIGSDHGIMDAAIGFVMDFNPVVNCFYQGNDLAWDNPVDSDDACSLFLSTKEIDIQDASVFPNPTNGSVKFLFPTSSINQVYQIAVFDISGRCVLNQSSLQNQIDLSGISTGLYSVQIFEGEVLKAIARVSVQ